MVFYFDCFFVILWSNLVLLAAIQLVLRSPYLAPAVHSIACRVLLSILLVLPQMPPASLSPDAALHGSVLAKTHELCAELGSGTTSAMSKSLGLVIRAGIIDESERTLISSENVYRRLDLLLHPRVPPLVRSLPHVESLSLFRAEESLDEIDARETLGLGVSEQHPKVPNAMDDIAMTHVAPEEVTMQISLTTATTAKQIDVSTQSPPSAQPEPHSKIAQPRQMSPFPPPPDPLPSSSVTQAPIASGSTVPVAVKPVSAIAPVDEEEDEEMPAIDMDSDSE